MRLARLSICVGVCVVATAVALARAPLGPATAAGVNVPPRARLTHFACQPALDPGNRSVSVRAVMRPLAGTQRLAVRFELLQRIGSAPPTIVRAGDLGVWVSPSNPTLGRLPGDVWRLDKTVIDLDAPATYQFRVLFRWTGPSGTVLGSAVRYSRKCRQPELRPDLAVTSLAVTPVAGSPSQDLYTAVIANRGLTAAGPFEVLFVPGGSAAATTDSIPFLGAGHRLTLSFTGPVCNPGDPPSVTADAAHEVDDYNRANNVATAVCPGS
jgi:CARDB